MDHRGNPEFPGMVVTMIEDDMPPPGCSAAIATDCAEAEGTGNISSVNGPSECLGLVFLVPDAESGALIRELDWRERGGYSRHVVSVQLLATSPLHRAGDRVQAVVYTGTTCNPNFFDPVSEEVVWGRVPAVGPVSGYRRYPPRLYGRDIVADIISTAQGPSGHNIDYLFQLTSYFKQLLSQGPVLEGAVAVGGGRVETDFYLLALESKVRMRLGAWRGFCLGPDPPNKTLSSPHTRIGECVDMCNFPLESCRNGGAGACGCGLAVVGFGNNEAGQVLGRSTPVPHLLAATAVDLVTRALDEANRTAAVVGDPDQSCGTSLGLYCYDPLFAEGCESSVGAVVAIVSVYAGSNHSGILFSNGELYVWGGAGATGTNTTATPLRRLQGVIGASFGFDYILALHRSGAVLSLRLGGSEGVGACPGMPDFVVPVQGLGSGARDGQLGAGADTVQRSGVASRVNISHLSCGLHHAVAVGAEDGRCVLYSWGDSRHGQRPTAVDAEDGVDAEAEVHQSLPPLPPRESEASISARPVALPSLAPTNLSASFPYSPSATTGVRSLACGARHTVLIDSNNNVWSCGDNRYGSLGRVVPGGSGAADPVLRRVAQNLPSGAYWQRVCAVCEPHKPSHLSSLLSVCYCVLWLRCRSAAGGATWSYVVTKALLMISAQRCAWDGAGRTWVSLGSPQPNWRCMTVTSGVQTGAGSGFRNHYPVWPAPRERTVLHLSSRSVWARCGAGQSTLWCVMTLVVCFTVRGGTTTVLWGWATRPSQNQGRMRPDNPQMRGVYTRGPLWSRSTVRILRCPAFTRATWPLEGPIASR